MAANRRVHPTDDFEHWRSRDNGSSETAPVGRREAYEVDEGIDDGAEFGSTNKLEKEVEVVGKTNNLLFQRFVVVLFTFVCLISITTFILTVFMISGKIGNRCSCADLTAESQQNQGK